VKRSSPRGILIPYFAPDGPALALSVIAFTIMQAFLRPSWDSALIPMIGAATLGVVNGLLFLSTPKHLTPHHRSRRILHRRHALVSAG
jgi:hypothetical protein